MILKVILKIFSKKNHFSWPIHIWTNFSQGIQWKFQDFSVTQILREINFGESRTSKMAVFAILGALNFVNLENLGIQKVQKFMKIKIQGL